MTKHVKRSNIRNTKYLLVESARTLFAKFGFKRTTVSDIAVSASVVKGAFYHYFNSKDEILEYVVSDELESAWAETQKAINALESPKDKFETFVFVSMREVRMRANAYAVLCNEFGTAPALERIRVRTANRWTSAIADILNLGIKNGSFKKVEVEDTANTLSLLLGSALISQVTVGGSDSEFERKLSILVRILTDGISQ